MDKILLVGGGGHCKSIIDSIIEKDEYEIIGIIDKKENVGKNILGFNIIGSDEELKSFYEEGIKKAFISIGSIGNVNIRKKIYDKLKFIGYELPIIMDKTSIISRFVNIEEGTYIGKNSIINANSSIGRCCIINTGVLIEHDCYVEEFVHLAPRSILCGNVKVNECSHIGANSVIIQGINIGKETIIGSGSNVVKDINEYSIAYGNPCNIIKKR